MRDVTLAELVSRDVALAAVERLRQARLETEEDLLGAVAAVASLVVPEALRTYADSIPVGRSGHLPAHVEWVAERHPAGRLAMDATATGLVAVYRDLGAVADAVEHEGTGTRP